MRKNSVLLIASLSLASLVLWSIRGVGDWFPMHDSTHVARILLMRDAWMSGQFPALWASHINEGLGYPLFHFYAPLFHTLSTALLWIFALPTTALKFSLWLTAFVGAYGTMLFARRWGRVAALVSGFAFALSPYMAISLYVRGSFSEYLSLALLPWVFLATERINSRRKVVVAAFSLALFILSHNLIPILALPMLAVWTIYHNYRSLKMLLATSLLAIALSAWFVIPLLFERSFTVADQVARTTSYNLHFVEPWQLWNSTWGFGGSAEGVEDGMSFKLGKLQIVLGLLGMIVALYSKHRSLRLISAFLLVSVWLTTSYSRFLWDASSILQIVQFPWRALGLIAFFLAILSGYFVSRIRTKGIRIAFGMAILGVMVFLNLKYFAPQTIIATPLDRADFPLEEIDDIATVVPEFMPIWLTQDNSQVAGSTVLPYAFYPTWRVTLDGFPTVAYPSEDGRLAFSNPTNSPNYSARQSHTPLQTTTMIISLLSTLVAITLYVKK